MLGIQRRQSTPFLVLLTLPATAMGFALSVQISVLSWILSTRYGLDIHDIGLVWAAGPLAGIIGQLLVGVVSDRVWFWGGRRRPFIIVGGTRGTRNNATTAASTSTYARTSSSRHAVISRADTGVQPCGVWNAESTDMVEGYASKAGGRFSNGVDRTMVVRVDTPAAARICASSASRSVGSLTRTFSTYASDPATDQHDSIAEMPCSRTGTSSGADGSIGVNDTNAVSGRPTSR